MLEATKPLNEFDTRGTTVTMPYTALPASLLESREQCQEWVGRATAWGDVTLR